MFFKKDKKLILLQSMVEKNSEEIADLQYRIHDLEKELENKEKINIIKDMEDLLYAGCTSPQLIDIYTTCKSLIETDKANKYKYIRIKNLAVQNMDDATINELFGKEGE